MTDREGVALSGWMRCLPVFMLVVNTGMAAADEVVELDTRPGVTR